MKLKACLCDENNSVCSVAGVLTGLSSVVSISCKENLYL